MKAPPDVVYAHLKYMWVTGAHEDTLQFLRQFSFNLARDLQQEGTHTQRPAVAKQRYKQLSDLLARCFFKQGSWQAEMIDDNWGVVGAFSPSQWLLY